MAEDAGGYAGRKDRERERQAAQSREGRDIGPIRGSENPKRRKKAESSFLAFCTSYFPHRFPLKFSDDHLTIIDRIAATVIDGGCQAFAMPRGSGKTTLCECAVLWAVMTGRRRFVALIGASKAHADEMLDSIRGELETNELLAEDFPEICAPIHALEGIHNRAKGQLCEGEPTRIRWAGTMLVLPTIRMDATEDGAKRKCAPAVHTPASSAIICVRGITGRVRGMKFRRPDGVTVRPDLVIIDDPQTDASAASPSQCAKRLRIICSAILGLAGPGEQIAAFCPCTIICPGDLAETLLDREQHPDWHGERTQLVYAMPKHMSLWDEYAERRRSDMAAGGDGSKATSFYRRNRKKMNEGAKVAWPARKLPSELSALQHAMNLRIDNPDSFDSEYQNAPKEQAAGSVLILDVKQQATNVSQYAEFDIPVLVERLTWFADVHKELLYWGVCGWEPGFTGHVLTYDTWPKQRTTYFTLRTARATISRHKEITAKSLEGKITQAMALFFADLSALEWKRDDGAELQLELGLVDANWGETTNEIYAACRTAMKVHGLRVMPSHGVSFGANKKPISKWEAKNTKGVAGDEWHVPPPGRGRAIRHVLFDANRRKSFLHRRLATPVGDPGSLTLYHAPANRHKLIAEHLTAEKGKLVSGPYGELVMYTLIPGRDNHWLDVLSGCCTAESMLGGKIRTFSTPRPDAMPKGKQFPATKPKRKPQRVTPLNI